MSRLNVGSSGTAPADAGSGVASAITAARMQKPVSLEIVMVRVLTTCYGDAEN